MHNQKFQAIFIVAVLLIVLVGQVYALGTAPNLGTATSFAVLGHSTVTNTGSTIIMGDLGLSPGTAVTGFPPGIVVPPGTIYIAEATALGAQNAATAAFIDIGNQACDFNYNVPTDLAGENLVPGVYCFSSSVENSGVLTLDGLATDVWIFKSGSSLTAGPGSSVEGTGSECNIFWQVGSSATLDTTSISKGTIIANQSISMNNGATLNGRAFALNGAVTLINNIIDASVCSGLAPGGVGVTKVFSPSRIREGNESTLTITFTNANDGDATLIGDFTDQLPQSVVVADSPNIGTTCANGVPSISQDGSEVTLLGGSIIPAAINGIPGYCTLTVDVTSLTVGTYTNVIPSGGLDTDEGTNAALAAAVLIVRSAPSEGEEDVGLPAFPGTGSGAPILNEVFPWNLLLFGGIFVIALVLGVLIFRKAERPK